MEKYGVIYRIHNKVTDNNYIGKTTRSFKKRYKGGLKGFIREKKSTDSIQEDYNEYGIDSFEVFEEIDCVYKTNDEEYDKDLLSITETYYINEYMAYESYNTRGCDYPLSISLFPDAKHWLDYYTGVFNFLSTISSFSIPKYELFHIKYKFELEDYYNYLFTDKHLKHFNELTDPKKKHRYSQDLILRYDKGVDIHRVFRESISIYARHFKGNITRIYHSHSYRWFNYDEFKKHHIELY